MTQNVISDIDGATGAVSENSEVVFGALGQEVRRFLVVDVRHQSHQRSLGRDTTAVGAG